MKESCALVQDIKGDAKMEKKICVIHMHEFKWTDYVMITIK